MSTSPDTTKVRQALADIIDGRTVRRARHSLSIGAQDFSGLFVQVLQEKGYLPSQVKDLDIRPGERVPAFHIEHGTAYFGWVFWEKFSDRKMRKLFGSVIRNTKGDWAVQIPEGKPTRVYACLTQKIEMDIDNPSGF